MADVNASDRRRHARHTVYEPCFVVVDNQEYTGAVVDMSVGGAAVRFEIELNTLPVPDTALLLQMDGIGRLHTRVVRSRLGSVAVEFNIDPHKEGHLLTALQQMLGN